MFYLNKRGWPVYVARQGKTGGWAAVLEKHGRPRRLYRSGLPVRNSEKEAWCDLHRYAKRKGWQFISIGGGGNHAKEE